MSKHPSCCSGKATKRCENKISPRSPSSFFVPSRPLFWHFLRLVVKADSFLGYRQASLQSFIVGGAMKPTIRCIDCVFKHLNSCCSYSTCLRIAQICYYDSKKSKKATMEWPRWVNVYPSLESICWVGLPCQNISKQTWSWSQQHTCLWCL